jgi:hypothetical protein
MDQISFLEFIKLIQVVTPEPEVTQYLRATPKGLFVSKQLTFRVITAYQQWLTEKGMPLTNEGKSFKRLFGAEEPRTYYLKEGKNTLTGSLIEIPIQQPQNLKMPYFLGSLDDTQTVFNPEDPRLKGRSIPDTERD